MKQKAEGALVRLDVFTCVIARSSGSIRRLSERHIGSLALATTYFQFDGADVSSHCVLSLS
jgi:hypothetical protein